VSGYFVIAQLDGKPVDPQLLERIAGRLVLRGLVGTSIWKKDNVGGSFTLMQTNSAPQSARQPAVLGDRYFLWGDLRLDGQTELRSQLGDHSPAENSGETSEELLLRAWNSWGQGALERVIESHIKLPSCSYTVI
jgi:asparagine synthetase B (glutamine-hydrolysing)